MGDATVCVCLAYVSDIVFRQSWSALASASVGRSMLKRVPNVFAARGKSKVMRINAFAIAAVMRRIIGANWRLPVDADAYIPVSPNRLSIYRYACVSSFQQPIGPVPTFIRRSVQNGSLNLFATASPAGTTS